MMTKLYTTTQYLSAILTELKEQNAFMRVGRKNDQKRNKEYDRVQKVIKQANILHAESSRVCIKANKLYIKNISKKKGKKKHGNEK
jgi:hypothetical protein